MIFFAMHKRGQASVGFTIVELLIAIVVIAILAAISIVVYNGVNERSRIAIRNADLATYTKASFAAREGRGGGTSLYHT